MTKFNYNKDNEALLYENLKLDDKDRAATREEIQKLVMDILEVTINDWDLALSTEEGMERLAAKFNVKYGERQ